MPQKPVIKGKKIEKKQAANKHGKNERAGSRKGKLEKPPKNSKIVALYLENKEITKMINEKNEGTFATKAESSGGKLKALKAGPPVLAPKGNKAKKASTAAEEEEEAMEEDD